MTKVEAAEYLKIPRGHVYKYIEEYQLDINDPLDFAMLEELVIRDQDDIQSCWKGINKKNGRQEKTFEEKYIKRNLNKWVKEK